MSSKAIEGGGSLVVLDPVKIFFCEVVDKLESVAILNTSTQELPCFLTTGEPREIDAPPEQTAEEEPSYAVRRRLFAHGF